MPRKLNKSKPFFENKLLDSLEFISLCQKDVGTEQQCFCILDCGNVTAFTGVIAMGHTADLFLSACPHTNLLAAALARCDREFQLIQISPERLDVRSGEFLASVPCCDPQKLVLANPDAITAPLGAPFKAALAKVAPLADDKADVILAASIHLHSGSVTATDNTIVLEAWHGFDFPEIAMPKLAAKILLKVKKDLKGFGVTEDSITFWFADDSWLKSMIYPAGSIDDVRKFLDVQAEFRKIDPTTFDAVKRIAPFSDGNVYFRNGKVTSIPDWRVEKPIIRAGEFNILDDKTLIDNRYYSLEAFLKLPKYATKLDERASDTATMFVGDGVRGAIAHTIYTEDIPF